MSANYYAIRIVVTVVGGVSLAFGLMLSIIAGAVFVAGGHTYTGTEGRVGVYLTVVGMVLVWLANKRFK